MITSLEESVMRIATTTCHCGYVPDQRSPGAPTAAPSRGRPLNSAISRMHAAHMLLASLLLLAIPTAGAAGQQNQTSTGSSTVGTVVGAAAALYLLMHHPKRPDTAAVKAMTGTTAINSGPAVIGATGSKGAVPFGAAVLRWTVVDDGSTLAVKVPSEPPRTTNITCGAQVRCVPGRDLRAVSVNAYGAEFNETTPLVVDIVVGNYGLARTDPTEGTVCLLIFKASSCAGDVASSASFTIPALPPGARAVLRDTLRVRQNVLGDGHTMEVLAVVDPHAETADVNRKNNAVAALDQPRWRSVAVEMQSVQMPPREGHDQQIAPAITFRLHNPRQYLGTGDRTLTYHEMMGGALDVWSHKCPRVYPEFSGTLPSLPAKATVEFQLALPPIFASCPAAGAGVEYRASVPALETDDASVAEAISGLDMRLLYTKP